MVEYKGGQPFGEISAAEIDGAMPWRIFDGKVLALMEPGVISVPILDGVWIPLIVAFRPVSQTSPTGIVALIGFHSTKWGLVFARVVIAIAPVIFACR